MCQVPHLYYLLLVLLKQKHGSSNSSIDFQNIPNFSPIIWERKYRIVGFEQRQKMERIRSVVTRPWGVKVQWGGKNEVEVDSESKLPPDCHPFLPCPRDGGSSGTRTWDGWRSIYTSM